MNMRFLPSTEQSYITNFQLFLAAAFFTVLIAWLIVRTEDAGGAVMQVGVDALAGQGRGGGARGCWLCWHLLPTPRLSCGAWRQYMAMYEALVLIISATFQRMAVASK